MLVRRPILQSIRSFQLICVWTIGLRSYSKGDGEVVESFWSGDHRREFFWEAEAR